MELRGRWRPAHQLNRKAEMELMQLIVHLDIFQKLQKLWSRIPRHPLAGSGHEITFQRRYRDAKHGRSTKSIDETGEVFSDFLVAFPTVFDEVHLIDSDDEMA